MYLIKDCYIKIQRTLKTNNKKMNNPIKNGQKTSSGTSAENIKR